MSKKVILIYIIFFLVGDILFSNLIYKKDFNHNCYEYLKDFFHLKTNCYAKEKWVRNVRSYDVYTDKNGFRFSGEEIIKNNVNKSAIFFGDSFTYGMGLDYKKTFVGLIENSQKDYKILNFGVPGYSPSVFSYQLKKTIKEKKYPKKIFFVLDISDVSEEASQWGINNKDNRPIHINKTENKKNKLRDNFKNSIKENFKGSRLIARAVNNFFRSIRLYLSNIEKENKKPGHSGWGDFLYMELKNTDQTLWQPFGFNEAINKIKIKSNEISEMAESIKAELYIIIYPWPDSLEYGQSVFNWEKFSINLCLEISCKKVINFFPDFRNIKEASNDWLTKLYINGDLHITEYGHRIIAEKILKEVF